LSNRGASLHFEEMWTSVGIVASALIAALQISSDDVLPVRNGPSQGLPLSISRSNNFVKLTWPQITGSWTLSGTESFNYYTSNDILYLPRAIVYPTFNYQTNGTNVSLIVSIGSTNLFFTMRTNSNPSPWPPLPQVE
jgi:hypothetical protein